MRDRTTEPRVISEAEQKALEVRGEARRRQLREAGLLLTKEDQAEGAELMDSEPLQEEAAADAVLVKALHEAVVKHIDLEGYATRFAAQLRDSIKQMEDDGRRARRILVERRNARRRQEAEARYAG